MNGNTPRGAKRLRELDAGTRRKTIAMVVVRATIIVVVILALYFLLPTTRPLDQWGEAAWLLIGGLVLSAVLVWQLRRVFRSVLPEAVALEVLVIVYVLFHTAMASAHLINDVANPGSYTEPLDHVGALYFTAAIGTTVGFGDISAVSNPARLLTTVHMVAGLAFIGFAAKLVVAAAKAGLQRTSDDADAAGEGDDRRGSDEAASGPPQA
jgi:hypothetical protein